MPKRPAADQSSVPPSELGDLASGAVENGLNRYLEDVVYADALVTWLHDETNVSKTILRLAVKLLVQLAIKAGAQGGALSKSVAVKLIERAYDALPGSDKVTVALRKVVERFNREQAARGEFTRWLEAHRTGDSNDLRQYLTLDLQADREILGRLDQVLNLLQPQPQLDVPLEPNTNENRFLFAARKVEFVGRERHLSALGEFLNSEKTFSWWLVAGPGGTGKSRLALELCLRLGAGWRIGFLQGHRNLAWGTWQPSQPTALIVDYANEDAERLGELIDELQRRADTEDLALPVRVLLLVRDVEGEWRLDFLGGQVRRSRIDRARFAAPLVIDPLDDEALWTVLCSFIPDTQVLDDKSAILRQLRQIDPEGRPLFASLAGDAIASGRDLRDWDQRTLVETVLDREKRHWHLQWPLNDPALRKHENLFALATLTGGMNRAVLEQLDSSLFPSQIGELQVQWYSAMSGRPATQRLEALVPDILGEVLVLRHLDSASGVDDRLVKAFLQYAWEISPEGTSWFLARTVMDFPVHQSLMPLARHVPEDRVQRLYWGRAVFLIIAAHSSAQRVKMAQDLFSLFTGVIEEAATETALKLEWAKAATNLCYAYAQVGDLLKARRIYGKFTQLTHGYELGPKTREQLNRCATNIVMGYALSGRVHKARPYYDSIVQASETYPDEPKLRECRVRAATTLISGINGTAQIANAHALFDEISELCRMYSDESPLQELHAKAIVNMSIVYLRENMLTEASSLFKKLEQVQTQLSHHPAFREPVTRAGYNLVAAHVNHGDITKAQTVYGRIARLAEAYPEDSTLRRARAEIALLVLAGAIRHEYEGIATQAYDDIVVLRNDYFRDSEIQEIAVMAHQLITRTL